MLKNSQPIVVYLKPVGFGYHIVNVRGEVLASVAYMNEALALIEKQGWKLEQN